MSSASTRHLPSSGRDDWSTPQAFFDQLDAEFKFTLDVCASDTNTKCRRYFTRCDDELAQPWGRHRCWMNPPYGRAIKVWLTKAFQASRAGALVVCLVPARTDTAWWHELVERANEVRFVRGRLRFGDAAYSAPFASVVVIFRPPCMARWAGARWPCSARCCGFSTNG